MAPVEAPQVWEWQPCAHKRFKRMFGIFYTLSRKHIETWQHIQSGDVQLETDMSRVAPLSTLILNYCQSVRALCKYWRAQAEHTQVSGGRHVIPSIITGWKKKILSDLVECLSENTLKSMSGFSFLASLLSKEAKKWVYFCLSPCLQGITQCTVVWLLIVWIATWTAICSDVKHQPALQSYRAQRLGLKCSLHSINHWVKS